MIKFKSDNHLYSYILSQRQRKWGRDRTLLLFIVNKCTTGYRLEKRINLWQQEKHLTFL